MRRRAATAAIALLAALAAPLASAPARAASPPPPPTCPSPGPVPTPTPAATPVPGSPADLCAREQLLEQLKAQIGSDVASGVAAQAQLTQSLQQNADEQAALRSAIADDRQRLVEMAAGIAARDVEMSGTRSRIDVERRQIGIVARAIYFQPGNLLLRLIRAGSLREMLVESGDLTAAANRGQSLQAQLDRDLQTLADEQRQQRLARQQKVQLIASQQAQLQQLQTLQQSQQQLSVQLAAKIRQDQAQLAGIDSQNAQLAQKIVQQQEAAQDALIATAMQQVWDQVQLWLQANPLGTVASSSGHSVRFRFVWPEPAATISQGFGPSTLWIEPAFGGYPHFHTGIDLAAPLGTPVVAADDGVVALVGSGTTGYGNYVVIAHAGGLTTLYGHLATAVVKQGDQVKQGQTIGLEGSTGASTGPHCHFELRVNGTPVDPSPYLPPGAPSPFKG